MKELLTEWRKYLKESASGGYHQKGIGGEWYHMSNFKFDNFKQQFKGGYQANDVGFHFGTKKTAMTVAHKLKAEGRLDSGDTVYLYTVELDANKPLDLPENRVGGWSVSSILIAMFEQYGSVIPGDTAHPAISDEAVDEYWNDVVTTPSGENLKELDYDQQLLMDEFKSWLNSLGFDSIVYENRFELGGESIIVFDPSQIKIIDRKEYEVP